MTMSTTATLVEIFSVADKTALTLGAEKYRFVMRTADLKYPVVGPVCGMPKCFDAHAKFGLLDHNIYINLYAPARRHLRWRAEARLKTMRERRREQMK